MTDQVEKSEATLQIRMPEDITIYGINDLHTQLMTYNETQALVLNLLDTIEIDSTGIQLLIALQVELQKNHQTLKLIEVSDSLAEVFANFQYDFDISLQQSNENNSESLL